MRCFFATFLPNLPSSNELKMHKNTVSQQTQKNQNLASIKPQKYAQNSIQISPSNAKNILNYKNTISKRDDSDANDYGNGVEKLFSHELDSDSDPLEEIMEEEYGFIQYDKFELDREFGKSNNTLTFMVACCIFIFLSICCKRYYVSNFKENMDDFIREAEDMASVANGTNSRMGRSASGKMSSAKSKSSFYRMVFLENGFL